MSTMIALLLVLSALVGCAGETLTNVKNALPDPPAETITFSVELEQYEETVRDGDGAPLAECSYQLPVLTARLGDGSVLEAAASGNPIPKPWRRSPGRTGLSATSPGWSRWPTPTI